MKKEEQEAFNRCVKEANTGDAINHIEGIIIENITQEKTYWSVDDDT